MARSRERAGVAGQEQPPAVQRRTPGKGNRAHSRYAGVTGAVGSATAVQRKATVVQREESADAASEHVHAAGEPERSAAAADPAPAERQVGAEIPAALKTKLLAKLDGSDAFKTVMKEIKDAGKATFPIKWSARGNYHSSGEIFLDKGKTEAKWVASIAHEVVHLSTFVRGKAADASTDNRADFVKKKMEDEINSQATSYITLLQIGDTTARAAGYKAFRAHIKKDHADALKNKQWAAIKTAALTWLEDKYRNEWTTSNTNENYYTYWGNSWDRTNPGS